MSEIENTVDTPVNELADIDSYIEPIADIAPEADEPERKEIDAPERKETEWSAGENAVGGQLLQQILEGALLTAGKPLTIVDLGALFEDHDRPAGTAIREALAAIGEIYAGRGFELREVASGFRFQVIQTVAPWIARMWEEKPQRYSRALLETLALIAYRQPITRGDIEDIRGVAVASNIMKTLVEREWVRIVGHKDVPGRPAMYATTRKFLDYFNLKNLDDLPPLAEIRDLDSMNAELALEGADTRLPAPLAETDADGDAVSEVDNDSVSDLDDDVETGEIVDSIEIDAETDLFSAAETVGDTDSENENSDQPPPQ